MSRRYKCLSQQKFDADNYMLVPIRDEDKYAIMKWRNEQIDILRQKELLSEETQNFYFKSVIDLLFDQDRPNQLLFSFLENDILIGYGGLVHIDWESKNGEISFLTSTLRNEEEGTFASDFENYLRLIFSVGFSELNFNKLHTSFYDIPQRQIYRKVIEHVGFVLEGNLKRHIMINGVLSDILIYSFFDNK